MVAFLTSCSLWGVSRSPLEFGLLGWKFILIHLACMFFFLLPVDCRPHRQLVPFLGQGLGDPGTTEAQFHDRRFPVAGGRSGLLQDSATHG